MNIKLRDSFHMTNNWQLVTRGIKKCRFSRLFKGCSSLQNGNGFSFVARQKRLLIEDDEFFSDLVFYNRLLRCFVVIEIKTQKITHQDLGQLQMYVNHYDRYEKLPDETPTVGILLCAAKNNEMVKLALPQDNKTILASQYKLYLPSESQLLNEIKKELKNDFYGGTANEK